MEAIASINNNVNVEHIGSRNDSEDGNAVYRTKERQGYNLHP